MQCRRSLLWAELKRGWEFLFVPSVAWETAIVRRGRPGRGEEDVWDEGFGAWHVCDSQAVILRELVDGLPDAYFARSMGSQAFGPFAVGTIIGQALDPAAAHEVKLQATEFLRGGAFTWRFIMA